MAIRTQQRTSAVLILAMLLMGAIIGSGISLSTIISDSSHQSQTLNDFISASLIADSGIERGLATVKVGRQTSILDTTVSAITPPTAIAGLTVSGTSLSNSQLRWSLLRPGESVSFDVLATGASGLSANANLITVSGSLIDVPNQVGRGQLDLSWVGLDNNGQPYYSGRAVVADPRTTPQIDLFSAANIRDISGNRITSALNLGLTKGFRVRLTAIEQKDSALISSADNIKVESVKQISVCNSAVPPPTPVCNPTGSFPSRIEITSTGNMNKSQSQKKASVLWQLPSTSAFSYVLFTEGEIIPE